MVLPTTIEEPEQLAPEELLALTTVIRSETTNDGTPANPGWVYCWNTKTGERVAVNRSTILTQLKKFHDDGTQAFAFEDPHITPPERQLYSCRLSKDSSFRVMADSYGFAYCEKKLRSPLEVNRHMAHRHGDENDTFKELEATQERQGERQWQESLIRLAQNRETGPVIVSQSEMVPDNIPSVTTTTTEGPVTFISSTFICPELGCGFVARGDTDKKRTTSLMRHIYGPISKHKKIREAEHAD